LGLRAALSKQSVIFYTVVVLPRAWGRGSGFGAPAFRWLVARSPLCAASTRRQRWRGRRSRNLVRRAFRLGGFEAERRQRRFRERARCQGSSEASESTKGRGERVARAQEALKWGVALAERSSGCHPTQGRCGPTFTRSATPSALPVTGVAGGANGTLHAGAVVSTLAMVPEK
jgi:hypothetical protein